MPLIPISETLRLYQEDEERKLMRLTNDSNRELMRDIIKRTKVTSEDLSRQYDQHEIRQLCLRTRVRVNMTHMNCVYDAKKILKKKGFLSNRSHSFINDMLANAVNCRMVEPCTDEEVANYHHIVICQLKKDNNVRLDCYRKEFEKQLEKEFREAAQAEEEEDSDESFIFHLTPVSEALEDDIIVGENIDLGAKVMPEDAEFMDNGDEKKFENQLEQELQKTIEAEEEEDFYSFLPILKNETLEENDVSIGEEVAEFMDIANDQNGGIPGLVSPLQSPLRLRDLQVDEEFMEILQTQNQIEDLGTDFTNTDAQMFL